MTAIPRKWATTHGRTNRIGSKERAKHVGEKSKKTTNLPGAVVNSGEIEIGAGALAIPATEKIRTATTQIAQIRKV